MILFDFHCSSCGKTFEAYVKSGETKCPCIDCKEEATRILSVPKFRLDGTDPGFPGAYDKWARVHEKAAR